MKAGFGLAVAGIAPLIVGAIGLGAALNFANIAGKFEQGVQRVANISGATAEELIKLRDAAIDAGLRTQFSPDQAVEGLQNLAAQGFKTEESISLLNNSLDLAAGGSITIQDATATVAASLRVFSLSADDAAISTDKLLKITNLTALQAKDLQLALGTVSRGAGATKQSLDEMLISMGLVKNTGVDASVAASGVSSALQFAAKNAAAFKKEGIEVTKTNEDGTNSFRDFLDIVVDTSKSMDKIGNAAERAALSQRLFGRFGTTAFVGISNQLKQMVKGRDDIETIEQAVAELRKEMGNAEGTAEQFASRLLDTFAGQRTILEGVLQTLQTLIGEPFAKVFKPIISLIATVTSGLARFINTIPENFKIAAAAFVVLGSSIFIVSGALAIMLGLVIALSPFMLAFVKIMLLFMLVLAPVTAAVVGLGVAIGALVLLAKEDIGLLGSFFVGTFNKIKLAFNALREIFTSGGSLSGPLAEELQKAENKGVLKFVDTIFKIGSRLIAFFKGIGTGFSAALLAIQPRVESMIEAFKEVGAALGLFGDAADTVAKGPLDDFVGAGASIGQVIGDALGLVVDGIKIVARFIGSFIRGVRSMFRVIAPVFQGIGSDFKELGTSIQGLFIQLGFGTGQAEKDGEGMGRVFGRVFGAIIVSAGNFIRLFVRGITFAIDLFRGFMLLPREFAKIWISVASVIENVLTTIANAFDAVLIDLAAAVAKIPVGFRTESVEAILDAGITAPRRIQKRTADRAARDRETQSRLAFLDRDESLEARQLGAARDSQSGATAGIVSAIGQMREADRKARFEDKQPIIANLLIDGEQVAQSIINADRKGNSQGFIPVPANAE